MSQLVDVNTFVRPAAMRVILPVMIAGVLLPAAAAFPQQSWAAPQGSSDRDAAESVKLRLHLPSGMAWPADVVPEVYPEETRDKAQMMWQPMNRRDGQNNPYSTAALSTAPGQFAFRIPRPGQPFYVAVHAPGFLRFFERGPFTTADVRNGVLELALEKPGILEVHFDACDRKPEDLPFDRRPLNVMRKIAGTRNSYLFAANGMDIPLRGELRITDLAAGEYLVTVATRPKAGVHVIPGTERPPLSPGIFHDSRELALAAGRSQRIDFHYVPLDLMAFRGHRTAVVRVMRPDGQPAAGKQISIGYFDGHYGALPVFDGPVPQSGEITLKEITDCVPENSRGWCYAVRAGEQQLGFFHFETKSSVETFTFPLAPDKGDPAPDVDLVSVATGKHTMLRSLRGKLVCIDFWATWCGPCQRPMQEIDELAAEKLDQWKDRLAIVPLSIDETPARVARHLKEHGWSHLEHFWAGPSTVNDFDAPAAKAFVVDAVPTAFLIGADGRILWRGHPLEEYNGKKLADRIAEALDPKSASDGRAAAGDSSSVTSAVQAPDPRVNDSAVKSGQTRNHLKMLALAMHNYHDRNRHFPPAVAVGPDGKTPHSWRIELLPYLNQEVLFDRYRMNEPWDSPNNKQVLEEMPDVFRSPYESAKSTNSAYFVLVGPGTIFESKKGAKLQEITDGTSNTLLVVEAKRNIPWTKPEDIPFDPVDKPLPKLGGFVAGHFSAAIADGSVRMLEVEKVKDQLKWLIMRNDGHPIDWQKTGFVQRRNPAGRRRPFVAADKASRTKANLQRLALAMHHYYDYYRHFPPAAVIGPDGKTPHSWRVELLPYLEQRELYEQYQMNEPWDSPKNKQVLERVPDLFRSPYDDPKSTNSAYFALVGPGTLFEGPKGIKNREVPDGLSNTIQFVEARRNIPWTKPEDIPFDPDKPLPELGGFVAGRFAVVMSDGAFYVFEIDQIKGQLKWLIMRNDDHVIKWP